MKDIERVIVALESIIRDRDTAFGDSQVVTLKEYCVDLSRLDCILPGSYRAAAALLEAIQTVRLHSRSVTADRVTNAVELLRNLSPS